MTNDKQLQHANGKARRIVYFVLALVFLLGAMYKLILPFTPPWADVIYISIGALVGILVLAFKKWGTISGHAGESEKDSESKFDGTEHK